MGDVASRRPGSCGAMASWAMDPMNGTTSSGTAGKTDRIRTRRLKGPPHVRPRGRQRCTCAPGLAIRETQDQDSYPPPAAHEPMKPLMLPVAAPPPAGAAPLTRLGAPAAE